MGSCGEVPVENTSTGEEISTANRSGLKFSGHTTLGQETKKKGLSLWSVAVRARACSGLNQDTKVRRTAPMSRCGRTGSVSVAELRLTFLGLGFRV